MNNINQVPFNMAQLATWEDARHYANILSAGPIMVGQGVSPETSDPGTSGIYIPVWVGGPDSPSPITPIRNPAKNTSFSTFDFATGRRA